MYTEKQRAACQKWREKNREAIKCRDAKRYTQKKTSGLCVVCGQRPAVIGKNNCPECAARLNVNHHQYKLEKKKQSVDYLGGKCQDCGLVTEYMEVYEFHHKNPENKDFNVSDLTKTKRDWEAIRAELDKCDLLCANCHRIRHSKQRLE